MVFYIIACNDEKLSEQQIFEKINNQVLVEKGKVLGTVHHMTNEKVSFVLFTYCFIGRQNFI